MATLDERSLDRIKRREDAIDSLPTIVGWAVAIWIVIGTVALAVAAHLWGH